MGLKLMLSDSDSQDASLGYVSRPENLLSMFTCAYACAVGSIGEKDQPRHEPTGNPHPWSQKEILELAEAMK